MPTKTEIIEAGAIKMRRYIEGSLRKKYITTETFNKVSIVKIRTDFGEMWTVVGPELKLVGEYYDTFTEALTFANAHTKKLGL